MLDNTEIRDPDVIRHRLSKFQWSNPVLSSGFYLIRTGPGEELMKINGGCDPLGEEEMAEISMCHRLRLFYARID